MIAPTFDPTATIDAERAERAPSPRTTFRPLGDRVVVRPKPGEQTTKSGLVIPDTAREKPQEGGVIAVGPGRVMDDGRREPMDVSTGDTVLYARYAGTEFTMNDEDLLIVAQKDILAIVDV